MCCTLHQQRSQVKRNRVCHKNAAGAQSAPPFPTKTKGNKVGPLLQDCQRIPPWSSSCRVPDPHSKQETDQGDKIRWLCVQKCRREPPDQTLQVLPNTQRDKRGVQELLFS